MSEAPTSGEVSRSILSERVTSVHDRLLGSLFIILALLLVSGVLYTVSLSQMNRAIVSLEERLTRAEALNDAQQAEAFAEVEAARREMRVVPLVWGSLIGAAAILATVITIRSIAQPARRLTEAVDRLAAGHLDQRVPVVWADEFGRLAKAFNDMADELETAYTELQWRVKERTRDMERRAVQLEAAAEVARRAAAIHDIDALLDETVHLISQQFGFYHAGLFLLDEAKAYAVLRAASSEGGQRMLEREHRLKVGEVGIVGHVAGAGEPRIALDVGEDAVFFDNPDLPRTRSEMALPLKVRQRVIGVLDVQSVEAAAFTDEDGEVLQTMADQVAMAIENARLVDDLERTVRELEIAQGEYVEEAWQAIVRSAGRVPGYRYRHPGLEPVVERPLEARQAWREGRPVITADPGEGDGRDSPAALAVPMKLRGQTVGALNLRFEDEPTSDDVEMIESIADRLALALENARLLEETRHRAAREQLIGEITTRMRESLDVETVLQAAVHEMRTALDLEEAEVRIMRSALVDSTGSPQGGDET